MLDLFQRICETEFKIIPIKEYKFCPNRKWRADYFLLIKSKPKPLKVLIEIEGIYYRGTGTRHQRGRGYEKDIEKYNMAQILGYILLRFTPRQIKSGYAIETIKQLITTNKKGGCDFSPD